MKKISQIDRVLQYMKDFGSITTLQAFTDLGVTRLSDKIFLLKKRKIKIESERIEVRNRYNDVMHVCEYYIVEE